jgi:hypothetical protein
MIKTEGINENASISHKARKQWATLVGLELSRTDERNEFIQWEHQFYIYYCFPPHFEDLL